MWLEDFQSRGLKWGSDSQFGFHPALHRGFPSCQDCESAAILGESVVDLSIGASLSLVSENLEVAGSSRRYQGGNPTVVTAERKA